MPTTRRVIKDQVIGATQRAGIRPTVRGIGRGVDQFVKRAMDVASALDDVLAARQSGDPASVAIAQRLLSNPAFMSAMGSALRKLTAEIEGTAAEAPTDGDEAAKAKADTWPENPEPQSGSGLPGTDSRLPGSYSMADLHRDLQTQNNATAQLAITVGMDSARARVAADPLIPSWDSIVWSPEARAAFRVRASYDGAAAAVLDKAGAAPVYVRDYDARRGVEAFMDRFSK